MEHLAEVGHIKLYFLARRAKEPGASSKPAPGLVPEANLRLRSVGALALTAALAYVAVSGGLVVKWPTVVGGLLIGGVVGARSRWPVLAAAVAGATVLVLALLIPPWQVAEPGSSPLLIEAESAVVAGVASGAAAWINARSPRRNRWLLDVALLLLIGATMWVSVINLASFQPGPRVPSLNVSLQTDPAPNDKADEAIFRHTYILMRRGVRYYAAMREALLRVPEHDPVEMATQIREPALFLLFARLPLPTDIIPAFLVLAVAGLSAAFWATNNLLPRGGLLAALLLAGPLACVGGSTYVVLSESWAAILGLVAFALFVQGAKTSDMRWQWFAAVTAAAACLVREQMIIVLIALGIGAVLGPWLSGKERPRWVNVTPWLAGLALFAFGYAWHVSATGLPLLSADLPAKYAMGRLGALSGAVVFGYAFYELRTIVPYGIFALGVVGALTARPLAARVAMLCVFGGMVTLFILAGDAMFGYWGMMLLPFVVVAVPLGIAAITGLAEL